MARALRIERPGGRFHVIARGNERQGLFRDDTDHFHFLELLSEQKFLRGTSPGASWARIVRALERAKADDWAGFVNRHGDWGRDAALWLGRRAGRLRLAELGQLAGGLNYAVTSKAIARFGRRLARDACLSARITRIQNPLSK